MLRQRKVQNAKEWLARKHVKICSYLLVIMEVKTKLLARYSFTTVLLAKAFKSYDAKC